MGGIPKNTMKKDLFYCATTTVPLMNRWILHMYVYVPVWLNVNWNVSPWLSNGELNVTGEGNTDVMVWKSLYQFVHVTVVPGLTVIDAGMNE